jgi:hypothetical protein
MNINIKTFSRTTFSLRRNCDTQHNDNQRNDIHYKTKTVSLPLHLLLPATSIKIQNMFSCVLLFSPRCRYAKCRYVVGCCYNNSHNAIMMNIVMLSVLASLRSTQITFYKLAPVQKHFCLQFRNGPA